MIKADYLVIINILESIQVHVSRSVINGEEKILFKLNISCSQNTIFQNEMSSFKSFQIKKKKKIHRFSAKMSMHRSISDRPLKKM